VAHGGEVVLRARCERRRCVLTDLVGVDCHAPKRTA
jgi:hypothetical protein